MTKTEYRRDDRHVYRQIAGEHLLIALHRDAVAPMFAFTPTAGAVWAQLEKWATQSMLVDYLVAHFDVDRKSAESDVGEFFEQLLAINALEMREVDE